MGAAQRSGSPSQLSRAGRPLQRDLQGVWTHDPARADGRCLRAARRYRWPRMADDLRSRPLANGLPTATASRSPGTRAVTILVAFDAGARTERPEENGMAHFLEHLVFKGGEKYADYRDVNETAERIGARAQRLHQPRPRRLPHHRARRERALEAIDLLTDFVGRPQIDAEELDRERGVVIQEIARAYDQPSTVAEHLIDRAAFGDHPLGRTVLGPEEHLRHVHARRRSSPSASAAGPARAAARSSSATSSTCPTNGELRRAVRALPRRCPRPSPTSPRPPFAPRDAGRASATPTSRTCG